MLRIRDILVRIRISFFAYYFLEVHLHHVSKLQIHKEVTNSRNQGFSFVILLDDRRILIPGQRSQIREAQKHTDPDPQHCVSG
jgi:hypothetical protein